MGRDTCGVLPNRQFHPLSPSLQGPRLGPQGFAWPSLWPLGSRSGLQGNGHTSPQSTPTPTLSLAHRHRLYPALGASCQLGQSSVRLGADGRSGDPLGSSRAMQIPGNASPAVCRAVSKPFGVGIHFHFLGGAPRQCPLLPMNKEELVGLPIGSKYKHGWDQQSLVHVP